MMRTASRGGEVPSSPPPAVVESCADISYLTYRYLRYLPNIASRRFPHSQRSPYLRNSSLPAPRTSHIQQKPRSRIFGIGCSLPPWTTSKHGCRRPLWPARCRRRGSRRGRCPQLAPREDGAADQENPSVPRKARGHRQKRS